MIRRSPTLPALLAFLSACGGTPAPIRGSVELPEVAVAPLATARVVRVLREEGDRVHAGDTLAVLTQADADETLADLRARVASAEATVRDLQAGARPQEIARAEAELSAATAEAFDPVTFTVDPLPLFTQSTPPHPAATLRTALRGPYEVSWTLTRDGGAEVLTRGPVTGEVTGEGVIDDVVLLVVARQDDRDVWRFFHGGSTLGGLWRAHVGRGYSAQQRTGWMGAGGRGWLRAGLGQARGRPAQEPLSPLPAPTIKRLQMKADKTDQSQAIPDAFDPSCPCLFVSLLKTHNARGTRIFDRVAGIDD